MISTRYQQLIKFRNELGISVIHAAKYVGHTSTKKWIEWESNKVKVPNDVSAQIERIMEKFNDTKRYITNLTVAEKDPNTLKRISLDYINSFPDLAVIKHEIACAAVNQALAA